MKARGIKMIPGSSWIGGHKKVHAFYVKDRSYSQSQKIYAKLEKIGLADRGGRVFYGFKTLNAVEKIKK